MKQRIPCHCTNCDVDCTISFIATEDVVRPLFCPMCGESLDEDEDRDWPEGADDGE